MRCDGDVGSEDCDTCNRVTSFPEMLQLYIKQLRSTCSSAPLTQSSAKQEVPVAHGNLARHASVIQAVQPQGAMISDAAHFDALGCKLHCSLTWLLLSSAH